MDLADIMEPSRLVNQNADMAFPPQSIWIRENAMQPKTSRDIPAAEPRKDKEREQQKAVIKDADKTDQADRDHVHGDGDGIGLDRK
jgi:hypothetical protein